MFDLETLFGFRTYLEYALSYFTLLLSFQVIAGIIVLQFIFSRERPFYIYIEFVLSFVNYIKE